MQVTQPWQDELVDLSLQAETKLVDFRETQITVVNFFVEKLQMSLWNRQEEAS